MKIRIKNWITSVIGIIFIIAGGVMIWLEKDTVGAVVLFAVGGGFLYAKDDLIKKLIGTV